jgi:acetolactate synthase-1/2/3 large subunit
MVRPTAYAQLGAMPMVILTGQKPIKTAKQGKFQIIDVVEMMGPLTKYTRSVTHGQNVPAIVREAFRKAQEERPGAVHIELPEDVAQENVDNPHIFEVVDYRMPYAGNTAILDAVTMIKKAKKPLLLIGAGANRKRASKALTTFVDAVGIPFFNTQMGKGIIDERHDLFLGTAALSDDDFLHEAIDNADLIINVGHDTIEKPPFFMHAGDNRKVIHVNFFPAEIGEVYFPQLNVIGDIANSIEQLTKHLKPLRDQWDKDKFLEVRKNVNSHLSKYEKDDRFPILPQRLVKISRDILPDDGMITLDNGIYKIWYARNYRCHIQNGLILDNALATMGAGLASAMMTKMLYPNRKVVSVNGDGGFMMNSQELETAVRLGLDLVVIILNDNAYGMIQWKQEGMGLTDYGLEFSNPDFVKYAESYGAHGYRPESVADFEQTFQEVLNKKGLHIIDLAVDYSLNHEILNVRIKEFSKNVKIDG